MYDNVLTIGSFKHDQVCFTTRCALQSGVLYNQVCIFLFWNVIIEVWLKIDFLKRNRLIKIAKKLIKKQRGLIFLKLEACVYTIPSILERV
jgi:hypothetical protein